MPESVFIAGQRVSFVDAGYSTSAGIEDVLSKTRQEDVNIFVADVVKSFVLWAVHWVGSDFQLVSYFAFHWEVWLRLKLATGLGVAWTRDGGILQGCPLSMVKLLGSIEGLTPQLNADNLERNS